MLYISVYTLWSVEVQVGSLGRLVDEHECVGTMVLPFTLVPSLKPGNEATHALYHVMYVTVNRDG